MFRYLEETWESNRTHNFILIHAGDRILNNDYVMTGPQNGINIRVTMHPSTLRICTTYREGLVKKTRGYLFNGLRFITRSCCSDVAIKIQLNSCASSSAGNTDMRW